MGLRHDQGIVLRTYDFGEADKVVVLLSARSGKIRAVAKGVRKTKSRFGGRLEPFTHTDLVLYEGRNLDTITQVSVIEAYPRMRRDLDRILVAGSMAGAIDAVAQEDEPSAGLFLLLQRGLRALDGGGGGVNLLALFLLRVADAVGLSPVLDRCSACRRQDELVRFSVSAGGAVCSTCRSAGAVRVAPGLVAYLHDLAGIDLAEVPASDPLGEESLGLMNRFLEYHLERKLTSVAHV